MEIIELCQSVCMVFCITLLVLSNYDKINPWKNNFILATQATLIDPSFQGVDRLFVLSFENGTDREVHTKYFIWNVEIKDYNVIIDGRNFYNQLIKNNLKAYNNIRKIATGQGYDYTTGCLLDYAYFKEHFKLIAIDSSKQQKLDADPKAMQQINFTGNLERNAATFFIAVMRNSFRVFKRNR